MPLLILFLLWEYTFLTYLLPPENSYASFKTHLAWHFLCGGFSMLSQLAFCTPKILDSC